ncbi:MAG: PAS domain S-box protein [Hydrogenovibrio crunogenus]|uniref:histidine kinase n=1 Tax=Hydrogenovibrio crunogenus (strain DSM 25203 / XCL-2) TaxID=317025 RepID=Q31DW5_HYDCU|nr:PAS domain S-box protein [Hydrogenovibrio crunogenus]
MIKKTLLKFYEWPLVIAFSATLLAVYGLYQVFEQGNQQERQSWGQLSVERNKLETLTKIYDLRTQLKLLLKDAVVHDDKSEQREIFNKISQIRHKIVEESARIRRLASQKEELRILVEHNQILEKGLPKQFYYQSLLLDFGAIQEAKDVLYTEVIPTQDYADGLLSSFHLLVGHSIERLQQEHLAKKAERDKNFKQQVLLVIILVLVISILVISLVSYSKRRLQSYTVELEQEVKSRTYQLTEAKNELQNSLADLESILHAAPDGILKTDKDGKIMEVNPAMEKLFGYSADELIGNNVAMLMPRAYRKYHTEIIHNLNTNSFNRTNLMGQDGRVKGQHKEGGVFPIEAAIGPIKDSNQSGFTIIIRDITNNIHIEYKLKKQKELLETLWKATNLFMVYKDLSEVADYLLGRILKLTKSEYGFIGEVLHDADGQSYLKTHALTNIAWNEETRKFYDENAPEGLEFRNLNTLFGHAITTQHVVISNDPKQDKRSGGLPEGHPDLSAFLGVPVFYGSKLVGMYGLANSPDGYDEEMVDFLASFTQNYGALIYVKRMLSQQEEMHEEILKERNEAEKASQAKSQFLSSMSHELRTPLNAVLGFAQLLDMDENLTADQKDNIYEIVKAGNHLLDLINDVLDLAKIESGNVDLSIEPVGLKEVLEECRNLMLPVAENKGISLDIPALNDLYVRADRVRLKQILLNLLSNAVKYNDDHGRVWVECGQQSENTLRISVKDSGLGVPENKQSELFQPFNRLGQEGGGIEGTGVGLSITKTLIELMGGEIGYQPNTPKGSCFFVELHIDSCHPFEEGFDQALLLDSDKEDQLSKTILYIEDNPANLKLVSHVLAKRDHTNLITAHEPQLGIELAKANKPDLILLDINMPGMSGYEVLEVFKKDSDVSKVPVVAITANAMSHDIRRGKRAGFDDYLTKPLDVENFLKVVERYLTKTEAK